MKSTIFTTALVIFGTASVVAAGKLAPADVTFKGMVTSYSAAESAYDVDRLPAGTMAYLRTAYTSELDM
jgi:hypothetical protein